MGGVLLFDLDDTLVLEDARLHARALWRAAPTHPHCLRIGLGLPPRAVAASALATA